MPQPQLIEVDPHRIKFNQKNPRKHQGDEFSRLKQSVKEVGIVQLPTVRVLPAGFYEVIDGEGRVLSAQEAQRKSIWAVSLGIVDDQEALTMLQSANSVRSFGFLAECKGLAGLHRQGQSGLSLAKKTGADPATLWNMISIGYLPETLLEKIMQRSILSAAQDGGITWGYRTLQSVLPLRQVLPGQDPTHSPTFDGVYDYSEVSTAIQKILDGEITTQDQVRAYVEQRRRELFEERFNEELRLHLEAELAQTKQAIEEGYQQQLQDIQTRTTEQTAAHVSALQQQYEAQVNVLRQQYEDLDKQYKKLVTDVAKRPEIIAQREAELRQKLTEAERERTRFHSLQQQVQQELQQEVQKTQIEARAAIQRELSDAIKEQRKAMDKQLEQARADMEAYYSQKDQQRQLKAETSVRQTVAHGTELLTQTQQSFLLLTSPDFLRGIAWLPETEVGGLLAQIMAVQDTLTKALDAIRHGFTVEAQERVITHG